MIGGGSPDAKVGTAKHENILIYEFALFQLLFSSQGDDLDFEIQPTGGDEP